MEEMLARWKDQRPADLWWVRLPPASALSSLSEALNALSSAGSSSWAWLLSSSSSKEEEQRSTQVLCSRLVSGVMEERVLILLLAPLTARHSASPSLLRPSLLLWLLLLPSLVLLNTDFSFGRSPRPLSSSCLELPFSFGGESWSFLGGEAASLLPPAPSSLSSSLSLSSSASEREKDEASGGRSSKSALDMEVR